MDRITLETRNVSIEFPGVKALSNVDFKIQTGQVHAVVGANGAGKSTLMKVLAGAKPTYTGDVLLDGKVIEVRDPSVAKKAGIQIVYQEVDTALIPSLSVAENVMLNTMVMEMGKKQFVNWPKIRKEAKKVLKKLHIELDVKTLTGELSLAQKQMVLIARAVQSRCNFLILDEPTAPLSDTETEELFRIVQHLKETENIAVIFITHRLYEVLRICESYTVMRNGEIVDNSPITPATTTKEIVEKMLGRSFEENYRKGVSNIGEKMFEIEHLSDKEGKVNDVSLYVKKGEIIGLAGLVGAGKSETCKTIFGAMKKSSGTVSYNGKSLRIKNPSDAVKQGMGLVPEERRKEGALVKESVNFNMCAACLGDFCKLSFVNHKKTEENAKKFVKSLEIKTPSVNELVRNLSGGNQQKVVVGKWLAKDCRVYIFDEPTKGVDVGAKQDIYRLIGEIASQGNCVIYATCENSEILSITDRIYVMFDGKIMAELNTADTDEDEIMHYSVGGTDAYVKGSEAAPN
jgi:simple sugar transport system ATP-binding protein